MTNAVRWTCTLASFTLFLRIRVSRPLSCARARIHACTRIHVKTVGDTCACIHLLKCQRHVARSRWLPRVLCPVIFELENYPDVICGCMRARVSTRSLHCQPLLHCRWSLFFLTLCRLAMFAYRFAHRRINALCHMRCYCSTKRMPLTLANFKRTSSQTHGQFEMKIIIYFCTC